MGEETQLYFVTANASVTVDGYEHTFNGGVTGGVVLELSKFELLNLPYLKGKFFDAAFFPFTYDSREYKGIDDCEGYTFQLIHVNKL